MKNKNLFLFRAALVMTSTFTYVLTNVDQNQQDNIAIIFDGPILTIDKKNLQEKLYKDYIKACYQHRRGLAPEAFESYKQMLNKPHPLDIYDGFIRLLFDTGQFATIINVLHQKKTDLEKKFKDNLDLRLIFAQAYLYVGQQEEAEKQFTQLNEEFKDNDVIAYYTAISLLRKNNLGPALSFIEKCLARPALKNKHFLFYFLASKTYQQMNQPQQALRAIEKSLAIFPQFDRGLLLKAMILEQQGRINEAISIYQHFLVVIGRDDDIEKQLVQLLFSQKRFTEAANHLNHLGGKTPTPEYYFDLALIEFHGKQLDKALAHINVALEKTPNFTKAKLLNLEILLARGNHEKALSLVQTWLTQEPNKVAVVQILLLFKKAGISTDKIIETLEKTLLVKKSMLLYAALADLYLESAQYQKACEQYQQALPLVQDKTMRAKIAYQVAYTTLKLNKKDDAKKQLEVLIKDAAYPAAYNLLAYLCAQDENDLSTALTLVDKALELQADRPEFLDTKGQILLKMKKGKEAVALFKKALHYQPLNPLIQQHLKEAHAH